MKKLVSQLLVFILIVISMNNSFAFSIDTQKDLHAKPCFEFDHSQMHSHSAEKSDKHCDNSNCSAEKCLFNLSSAFIQSSEIINHFNPINDQLKHSNPSKFVSQISTSIFRPPIV